MKLPVQGGEFTQLRAFVAVAQQLSFSRAARELGVTPSSLSQMIRSLEARMGIRLLNRTTRSVATTPAGDALFQRLRPAMEEIASALEGAARFRDAPAGAVRVHTFRLAARAYIEPVLAAFKRAYPEILIDITVDDAVVDIVAGGWDVSIRLGEVVEKDMVGVPLGGEMRQYAVASPEYLARHGVPRVPEDLHRHDCIRWRWSGQPLPYNWEFRRDGKWFELVVDGKLIVSERPMMMAACLDGAGIAFASNLEADDHVASGRLVRLLEPWCGYYPGFFLCYPRQRQMAPALRAFIDFVRHGSGA